MCVYAPMCIHTYKFFLTIRSTCHKILWVSSFLTLDEYGNQSPIFSELPPAPPGIAPEVTRPFLLKDQLWMLILPQQILQIPSLRILILLLFILYSVSVIT